MNVTQTYKPGDSFLEFVTVPADAVVVATVWRNGSVVSGLTVSSPVIDGQCPISWDIPADWSVGDVIVVQLRGTSEEEDLDEPETYKFTLDNRGEKIDYIYDRFTFNPPNRPAIVLPAASDPDMTVVAVFLRDGSVPVNGEEVAFIMHEQNTVYLDGAHQVDRKYTGITGPFTDDDGVDHEGVAVIEVYDSEKLESTTYNGYKYNGLYYVRAKGIQRDVWVPPGGGELGLLPNEKPTP